MSPLLRCALFFVLTFIHFQGFTQDASDLREIDSLINTLNADKNDSVKLKKFLSIIVLLRNNGNLSLAKDYVEKGIRLAKDIHDDKNLIDFYLNKGRLFGLETDFKTALNCCYQALTISETLPDKQYQITCLRNISSIYSTIQNPKLALKTILSAQDVFYKNKESLSTSPKIEISLAQSIGSAYVFNHQNDSALSYLLKGKKLSEQAGIYNHLPDILLNIGDIYFEKEDYANTYANYKEGLMYAQKENKPLLIGGFYTALADVLFSMNNHKESIAYCHKSLEIARKTRFLSRVLGACDLLVANYESLKDYKKAFEYQSMYIHLKDSIYTVEKAEALAKVRTDYEVNKKATELNLISHTEKEKLNAAAYADKQNRNTIIIAVSLGLLLCMAIIAIVTYAYRKSNQDKKMIAEQQKKLQASLTEKEALLKEIHHRVKNNLQVISGLLNLQSGNTKNQEVKDIMSEGQNRVQSMALIHQMLYQNENLSNISFGEYMSQLTQQISASYNNNIQINIQTGDVRFDVDTAVPLGLIVNELVSNSFKYAFTDIGDKIDISLTQTDKNKFTLNVKDNGSGLPEGFDISRSKSLGLRLVSLLCRQMRAELDLSTQNGTAFIISFTDNWKTTIA